jgi:Flp pilus assembly protein TadG
MLLFRFLRQTRGAVSLVFALSTGIFLIAMLSGIDYMRWVAAQARAQQALDAAVLAAGRNLGNLPGNPTPAQLSAWKQDAIGYFNANWPSDYLGSSIDSGSLSISVSSTAATADQPAGQLLSMSVRGSMPLLVAGFLGTAPLVVGASNQALRVAKNNLEVVLVLDNTGSMSDSASGGSQSKMEALKSASLTLIKMLTPTTDSGVSAYFGLVPFTTTVNVRDANGNVPTAWLDNTRRDADGATLPATAPFSSSSWSGCMTEPYPLQSPIALQDPGSRPFRAYFDGWTTQRLFSYQTWSYIYQYSNFLQYYCPEQPTTFLTNDQSVLKTAINNMHANGSTFIASGVIWGWRMLSPAWRNASTAKGWGSSTLPQDSNAYLTKAMIIITDGANVWQLPTSSFGLPRLNNVSQSGGTLYSNSNALGYPARSNGWPQNGLAALTGDFLPDLRPYGTVSSNWEDTASRDVIDAIQLSACRQASDAGIKIWGIVYGKNDSTMQHSLQIMRQCVNQAAYYAPTDTDLQADFQSIAGQLSTLRLTQ